MGNRAEDYANEPVRYPALEVIDLKAEGAKVTEPCRNLVINRINNSCLRLGVSSEDYPWHQHPTSDELFIVVEGTLIIDLKDGRQLRLRPWQCVTVPAGTIHRTRVEGRTVNLCFEQLAAKTIFVETP